MRTTTFAVFVAVLLAVGASTRADTVVAKLTVDAGEVARKNAPVAARLELKADAAKGGAWEIVPPKDSDPSIPAQVERLADGAVIVRWIEPDLQPGTPKTYELVATAEKSPDGLRFVEGEGWRDLAYTDKGIWRHMNRYDAANHQDTFKPFHHVYGMRDEGFITNGPGSEEWGAKGEGIRYPHHRGLFFGYNKTPFGDFWHGKDGVSQRHRQYVAGREFVGPFVAREVSVIEWVAKGEKPVIRETREATAWRVSEKHIVIDFDLALESLTGEPIMLGGDAQHAGFHFRAANEVGQSAGATKPTTRGNTGGNAVYTRPAGAVAKGNDVWADCPWVHAAFAIKGNPYGVMEMNAPTNPQPTVFSTRPYGRFGAFVNDQTVAPGKSLKLSYRFIIRDGGEKADAKQLQAEYQDWITPVKVTVGR
jgi:hypothetical protein